MSEDQDWQALAIRVIRSDAAAVLAAIDDIGPSFTAAARRLVACRGKVLVTGSGTSGIVAHRAAHLFSVVGTPAFYLPPADGLHGGLGVLQPEDVVVAVKGGSSAELNDFCARARTLCGGLIVITASGGSALAGLADEVIVLRDTEGADLGSVVATGSSLASAAILDALVEVCRVARGYDWEKVLFTHPSGAVGRDSAETLARLQARQGSSDGA